MLSTDRELLAQGTGSGTGSGSVASTVDESAQPWNATDYLPKLMVGDPAPSLEIDHWIKGQRVESFQAGNIYVIDFWATWCGFCIVEFPELAAMQREFKEDGVVVFAVTHKESRGNTLESVTSIVKDPKKQDAIHRWVFPDAPKLPPMGQIQWCQWTSDQTDRRSKWLDRQFRYREIDS